MRAAYAARGRRFILVAIMHPDEDIFDLSDLERALRLQDGLIARAEGGAFNGGDPAYRSGSGNLNNWDKWIFCLRAA